MEKKKIFIICNRLGYGGAERVAVLLANGLTQRGHQLIIVSKLSSKQTYETDKHIKLVNIFEQEGGKYSRWISASRQLRKILKQERPDVIIGIMEIHSLLAKIASIGLGIPIIATMHNTFERPDSQKMSKLEYFLKFYVNKLFSQVTVLTEADKKVIGNRLKHVVVMPNPLSTEPTTSIEGKKKQIIAVGRLDWHYKGFDILLKAWGKIANTYPEWTLKIAGDGSSQEFADIENMMKENNVTNRAELLGFRNDIKDLFRQSEVFILSSRYEGFGLVLIEAMSQGCACVACDYKGRQSEIITNASEGVVCPPEDVDALAEAMKRVLDDADYRKTLQQNAIERSKYYSLENTIDRWENLIEKVTNS